MYRDFAALTRYICFTHYDKKFRKEEVDAAVGAARNSGKNKIYAESFTDGSWQSWAKDDWSFRKLKPIADQCY